MTDNDRLLKSIATLVAREYPEPSSIKSHLEVKMWMDALEALETRIMLSGVLVDTDWKNSPKQVAFHRDVSAQSKMQLGHLLQAKIMMEQFIVNNCSFEDKRKSNFPFREILKEICKFKAILCDDPALKRLFMCVSESIENKEEGSYPTIAMIPKKESRQKQWYKYYGFYKAILGVIDFKAPAIEAVKFNLSWLKEDEGILILFFSYAIQSGQQKERLPKILSHSKSILREQPSLKPIHNAMMALSI